MQDKRGNRRPERSGRKPAARTRRHTPRVAKPKKPTAQGHALTFTSRSAVLGLTMCAVVVMLAYPAKQYLGQRAQISSAEAQQRQLQQEIAALGKQHAAATDPATVEAQARAELHYTLPGTRNYIVVTPPKAAAKPVKAGHATLPADAGGTWYGTLWQSDTTAGR